MPPTHHPPRPPSAGAHARAVPRGDACLPACLPAPALLPACLAIAPPAARPTSAGGQRPPRALAILCLASACSAPTEGRRRTARPPRLPSARVARARARAVGRAGEHRLQAPIACTVRTRSHSVELTWPEVHGEDDDAGDAEGKDAMTEAKDEADVEADVEADASSSACGVTSEGRKTKYNLHIGIRFTLQYASNDGGGGTHFSLFFL